MNKAEQNDDQPTNQNNINRNQVVQKVLNECTLYTVQHTLLYIIDNSLMFSAVHTPRIYV